MTSETGPAMPHDQEAEQATLGAMLLAGPGHDLVPEIAAVVGPEDY